MLVLIWRYFVGIGKQIKKTEQNANFEPAFTIVALRVILSSKRINIQLVAQYLTSPTRQCLVVLSMSVRSNEAEST